MWNLSPTQVWLCGHHYSNFLLDFMATFKSSALSHLYDPCILLCQSLLKPPSSLLWLFLCHVSTLAHRLLSCFEHMPISHSNLQSNIWLLFRHPQLCSQPPRASRSLKITPCPPAKMAIYSRCTSAQPQMPQPSPSATSITPPKTSSTFCATTPVPLQLKRRPASTAKQWQLTYWPFLLFS